MRPSSLVLAALFVLGTSCAASGSGDGSDPATDSGGDAAEAAEAAPPVDSGRPDSARPDTAAADAPTADTATADTTADAASADAASADTAPVADTAVAPPDAPLTPPDLATATVLNSPADIASWPATATITKLDLGIDGVHVDFTKRDGTGSWPDVPFGAPGDSLEYTLWIVLEIDGASYTSGCIQFWRGLDRNGGPPSGYAANWYYDAIRWGKMTGHQPKVGEPVGFFVSAGDLTPNLLPAIT